MGFHHRILKAACGSCKSTVLWNVRPEHRLPVSWKCEYGVRNYLASIPEWPDLPRPMYIGAQKHRQFKVYPMPPESPNVQWALPYSIRSFVAQASRNLGGCDYNNTRRGIVMGEDAYEDYCYEEPRDIDSESHNCHLVGGWTAGETTCPLWERISRLGS